MKNASTLARLSRQRVFTQQQQQPLRWVSIAAASVSGENGLGSLWRSHSSPRHRLQQQHQHQQQQHAMSSAVVLEEEELEFDPHHQPHPPHSFQNNSNNITTTQKKKRRPLYVSATRQHVGKTTTSLALVSGLQKRVGKIGFMKPVGQVSLPVVEEDGTPVACDKDAVLVKQHFGLHHLTYKDMSPVLIPKGYTKDYVDGKIGLVQQRQQLLDSYRRISHASDVVVCEGTGHTAVGSIVDASNAEVAAHLGARMVLVANGGLGNALDELELNKVFCDRFGVDIAGVIINKVKPDKYEQTKYYLSKALNDRWGDVPLLGLIPDRPFLGCPAVADLEKLFADSRLVAGQDHRYRHYTVQSDINLVATSLEVFLKNVRNRDPSRTLYVSHSSRNDILLGFIMEAQQRMRRREGWEATMIVTGCDQYPVSNHVLEMLRANNGKSPPVLLVPKSTAEVMEKLHQYTPKLYFEDGHRVDTAITHYEDYIDFDLLLERASYLAADDYDNSNDETSIAASCLQ